MGKGLARMQLTLSLGINFAKLCRKGVDIMAKKGLIIICIMALSIAVMAETSVIRLFNPTDMFINSLLINGADIASFKPHNYIDVVAADDQLDYLKEQGFAWEITQTTEQLTANLASRDLAGYRNYDEMLAELQLLASTYPNLCMLTDIGDSRGSEYAANGTSYYDDFQHDIWALKISDNVTIEEDEHEVYYFGAHHAREPISMETAMGVLLHLVNNYGTDPQITEYVNNTQIWFVPLVNPNGHKIVWDQTDVWWRKNIRDNNNNGVFDTDHSSGTGDDGVDPNRNYGFEWGFTGASGNPNGETYHGPEPFSEPELQAIRDLMMSHHFVAGISYHTYGEQVLYPYGYANNVVSPDHEALDDLAAMIATNTAGYGGGTYTYSPSYELYPCMGTTDDYGYGQHGTFAYTVEEATQFIPGASAIQGVVDSNVIGAMKILERLQSRMLTGHITDATTGDPLVGTIFVEGIDDSPIFREPYCSEPAFGRYHRLLLNGTYTVTFSAFGYEPVTCTDVQIVNDDVTVLDVAMTQNPDATISGEVRDGATSLPIEGAIITLLNTPLEPAVTNTSGVYEMEDVPYGTYTARVDADDYGLMNVEITVAAGATSFDFLIYPADIEDFELAMFSSDWSFTGNADWEITNLEWYEGYFSARSGSIGHSASTGMEIVKECAPGSEISFWVKTSSEAGYDFLRFMVDNAQVASWSGETDWTYFSYAIDEGQHEFTWLYSKDTNTIGGSDCAWVDYIIFPNAPVDASQPVVAPPAVTLLGNYPNPFNPETTISFSAAGTHDVSLAIYNAKGRLVRRYHVPREQLSTINTILWNGKDQQDRAVATGIYFTRITSGDEQQSQKMMLIK